MIYTYPFEPQWFRCDLERFWASNLPYNTYKSYAKLPYIAYKYDTILSYIPYKYDVDRSPPRGHAGMSKNRSGPRTGRGLGARDTSPSPQIHGWFNRGGCERAWVTVGCDNEGSGVGCGKKPHISQTEGYVGRHTRLCYRLPSFVRSAGRLTAGLRSAVYLLLTGLIEA